MSMPWQGSDWRGKLRWGVDWHGTVGFGRLWLGKARRGVQWHGRVWLGRVT